jgi:hypothetical protein
MHNLEFSATGAASPGGDRHSQGDVILQRAAEGARGSNSSEESILPRERYPEGKHDYRRPPRNFWRSGIQRSFANLQAAFSILQNYL